jgi:hypothetical protein
MAMNLVLALFWLALALASLGYFLLHPAGGTIVLFGNDVSATWIGAIGIVMFVYNMLRWWVVRVRRREREVMNQISRPTRRQPEERNPDFDFSEGSDKRQDESSGGTEKK